MRRFMNTIKTVASNVQIETVEKLTKSLIERLMKFINESILTFIGVYGVFSNQISISDIFLFCIMKPEKQVIDIFNKYRYYYLKLIQYIMI